MRWVALPRATLAIIVDQEEMLRIHPLPDDARMHAGQDFALLTNSLALIHDELQGIRALPRVADAAPRARPPAAARAN
ncbi:MAG TPA: hypothetical protein VM582_06000 [Candidatus Thermoplasmatota archaeon]|nr:hypothetical protein [Candidatus Thermoplasmatota archaeon]